MSNKHQIFKNPARKQEAPKFKPYVQQYKVRGLEPEKIAAGSAPSFLAATKQVESPEQSASPSDDNPRLRPDPFIEVATSIPSVGNNSDNSWVGEYNEIFDEESPQEIKSAHVIDDLELQYSIASKDFEINSNEENNDTYFLTLKGELIKSSSNLKEIEEEVKALVFSEHPLCQEKEILIEDIMVLKKMKIKIGVFLGE